MKILALWTKLNQILYTYSVGPQKARNTKTQEEEVQEAKSLDQQEARRRRPSQLVSLLYKYEELIRKLWSKYNIVALECKPANSQQGNFKGQAKNNQNLMLFLWKETIFSIFFLYNLRS